METRMLWGLYRGGMDIRQGVDVGADLGPFEACVDVVVDRDLKDTLNLEETHPKPSTRTLLSLNTKP